MFFLNLLLLILTGTLMLGWVLYFTDLFPVIGGLLGLGGLFAWIAFLGNLVSKNRKAELQTFIDERIMQRRWFLGVIVITAVAFMALVPANFGTIVINNAQHDRARTVEIQDIDGPGTRSRLVVPARTKVRHLVATGFLATRAFHVKADGLPWVERPVASFHRQQLTITGDFRRRHIVLIRPHAGKLPIFGNESRTLRVTISAAGQTTDLTLKPRAGYRGETVWLGAAADVEPTAGLTLDWRFELERAIKNTRRVQHYSAMWNHPISLSATAIAAGSTISASVTRDDSTTAIISGQVTLPDPAIGPTIIGVIMQ